MKKYFTILLLATSTIACNQNEEPQVIHDETNHREHDNEESIQLNNGNKWKVVETMLIYIRNMETALIDFEKSDNKDYVALAKVIDKNIRDLTSNCTMEGQAHDELHKWLLPFIELSEDFDVATDPTEQEEIYKKFKAMFVEFNIYFE